VGVGGGRVRVGWGGVGGSNDGRVDLLSVYFKGSVESAAASDLRACCLTHGY
jgi:hypothetical protein